MRTLKSSWKEAKKAGEKKYFTGKPCKHGHIATRFTCNRECVECDRLRRLKRRKNRNKKVVDNWVREMSTKKVVFFGKRGKGHKRFNNAVKVVNKSLFW